MRLHFGRRAVAALVVVLGIALGSSGADAANLDEACGGPAEITCNSALWCQLPTGNAARRCRRHLRQGAGFLHAGFAAGVRLQRQDLSERMRARKAKVAIDTPAPARTSRARHRRRPAKKTSAAQALTVAPRAIVRRHFRPVARQRAWPARFRTSVVFRSFTLFATFPLFPRQTRPKPGVETARLIHAVKNAWAAVRRQTGARAAEASGEIDVVEDCGGAGGHHRGGPGDVDGGRRRGRIWSVSGAIIRRERSW